VTTTTMPRHEREDLQRLAVPLPPPAAVKPTATAPAKALSQRSGDMDDEIPF
jgi:hypothetical protein